jgi:hypothetical protein
MPRRAHSCAEADLYPAVKAFLEAQGYDVKGEIRGCDVVATRGEESPVIVELKLAFSLALLLQGVDRLRADGPRVSRGQPAPRAPGPARVGSTARRA